MGAYVNPRNSSKEEWLQENAESISQGEAQRISKNLDNGATGQMAVCLVDNGPFTAAGIIHSEREFQAFSKADDPRPKRWFKAEIEDLLEVSGELEHYLTNAGYE